MSIPLLDLQKLPSADLDRACQQWGFFALSGHGVDPSLIDEVLAHCDRFFAQPTTVKNQIRRSAENAWGFYDAELTKNRRDWKEIIDIGAAVVAGPMAGTRPQWPDLPGFQACMEAFMQQLHRVAMHLVHEIGATLGSTTDLSAAFREHSSFLRLNYYPSCEDPAPADAPTDTLAGHFGISHHTDAGALTVLLQDDQPGLQVLRGQRWHTVTPVPGTLIINVGDIVQVWSNDRYTAPVHRVLAAPNASRISTPYFLNPSYDYDYAPLAGTICGAQPPRYKPINWGAFRQRRSAGDYADYGQEVQISDFRI